MADINDPIVIRFLNEAVRPMNERLRRDLRSLSDVLTAYDADVDALLASAADDDVLADGRESEGVPLRTVGELRRWLLAMRMLEQTGSYEGASDNTPHQTAFNNLAGGNVDVPLHLAKFTVRNNLFQ